MQLIHGIKASISHPWPHAAAFDMQLILGILLLLPQKQLIHGSASLAAIHGITASSCHAAHPRHHCFLKTQ
eukprot:1161639-Pelagomonas_calceolata.AAC.6